MSSCPARPRTPALLAILSLLGVVALSGCASRQESSSDAANGADAGNFPVTVQAKGAPALTLQNKPKRIVSLSATVTEILYEVGAGSQVVAAGEYSTYPEKAPNKKGLSGLTPNAERLATFNPDLVIVNSDQGGKLAAALRKLKVATLVVPAAGTLDEMYAQFTLLGKATGHKTAATKLAGSTRTEIKEIVANTPEPTKEPSYFHELSPSYYTMTSATFVGNVYSLFNMVNIADQGNPQAAGGSPQLSAEQILDANPDLIFLADTECCGVTAEKVAARPGWDTLAAVENGRIFELDDDIASRWGPRIVEFVRSISKAIKTVTNS